MANITGINPPPLEDQEYVDKINTSLTSIDNHDHTSGKGLAIGTNALAAGAVTDAKVSASAAIQRTKLAAGNAASVVINDNSGGFMTDVGSMDNGEIVIGQTGGVPVKGTITGTANRVSVTNGAGSITLSAPQDIATTSNVKFGTTIVGTGSIEATAILQATSTTKGFLPPKMTTAQRDAIVAPATGLVIYNTTTNQLNIFNGSWGAVGGGTFVSTFTGTTITATNDPIQVWRYTGGSAQTLTSIDQSAAVAGATIEIVGTSDTNTITVNHNDVSNGIILNGAWTGVQYSVLTLRWDATFARFVEVSRNGI